MNKLSQRYSKQASTTLWKILLSEVQPYLWIHRLQAQMWVKTLRNFLNFNITLEICLPPCIFLLPMAIWYCVACVTGPCVLLGPLGLPQLPARAWPRDGILSRYYGVYLNSLWLNATCHRRSWWILLQVMACRLTARSHHTNVNLSRSSGIHPAGMFSRRYQSPGCVWNIHAWTIFMEQRVKTMLLWRYDLRNLFADRFHVFTQGKLWFHMSRNKFPLKRKLASGLIKW